MIIATYLVFITMLIGIFLATFRRIRKAYCGITPLFAWFAGLFFFVVMPLFIITLNGGYSLGYVSDEWGTLDLSDPEFFFPFLTTWLSLFLCCFVVITNIPRAFKSSRIEPTLLSTSTLRRILWISAFVIILDWIINIYLAGGLGRIAFSYTLVSPRRGISWRIWSSFRAIPTP